MLLSEGRKICYVKMQVDRIVKILSRSKSRTEDGGGKKGGTCLAESSLGGMPSRVTRPLPFVLQTGLARCLRNWESRWTLTRFVTQKYDPTHLFY